MRDAMIAGATLNIFNNHADRVRMANLAQAVNVLQSLVLTKGEKMILTPTYYVMKMYKVHQDATLVPMQITSDDFVMDGKKLPAVSASGSIDRTGKMHISLTNIDNKKNQAVEIDLKGYMAKSVTGEILTSPKIQDRNTFDDPAKVTPATFSDAKLSGNTLIVNLPPISVVVLELTK